ncbi:tyrosine-type recombinase/integrase [Haloechinothrix halophila]|uniref:Site-specific recombinase XerD n=1 Tax=Haloechinothrix halophila YIM 93223 TaxID=592678 RepID=W9DN92_9PSEU|nr:tyrosine-type recombinase/integrase [Haloechinothrix halophila]ETA66383.1 site-specific recombinase XerD [Haloechinothrix halophila YIM 93223]
MAKRVKTSTPGIWRIEHDDGQVTYRAVVDAGPGPDPKTGTWKKRRQIFITRRRFKDVKAERDKINARREESTHRQLDLPKRITVQEAVEAWLASRRVGKRGKPLSEETRRLYRNCATHVIDFMGGELVQNITEEHVEALRDGMESGQLRRIGQPGQPMSAGAIRLTIRTVLGGTLAQLVKRRQLQRNPVDNVELPALPERDQYRGWTVDEVVTFLRHVRGHRLHALFLLSTLGMRRGEVLALTWANIDLDGGRLSIPQGKTENAVRNLPIPPLVVDALRSHRDLLRAEASLAEDAYSDSGFLAVDELGRPLSSRWYSDEFHRVSHAAGLRRIRLHDLRHTAGTLMRQKLGLHPEVIAKWLGHARGSISMKLYVDDPREEALHDAAERFGTLLSPPAEPPSVAPG